MADILHYLLLGVVFAVATALENMFWTRFRNSRQAAGPAGAMADPVVYICRLDQKRDPEELASALLARSRLLLDAFLAGDVSPCQQMMTPEVYAGLTEAAQARQAAGPVPAAAPQMRAAEIVDAAVGRDTATLRLALFAAGPGSAYNDRDDEDEPMATDIWTYERSTYRNRPEWLLVGTEPLS
jgi:predicted lipid-binding transport protein (Tim44 family)